METEKIDGKDLSLLTLHRCGIVPGHRLVMMQIQTDDLPNPLTIALQPDQAKKLAASLTESLARLKSIR